jgi:hypothetical protein
MHALYVVASFKETQVSRMVIGQGATIKIDALDGKLLKGSVESFAPGSGSQFSPLPFEPGRATSPGLSNACRCESESIPVKLVSNACARAYRLP